MSTSGNSPAVIVGIGETKLGKRPGVTAIELQAEAVIAALADAGLGKQDLDGLFNLGPYSNPSQMFGLTLAEYLGARPSVQAAIDGGGTWTPLYMLANCIWAVEAGQCTVAVCTYGEPAATGRPVQGSGWTTAGARPEYEYPFGITGAVGPYGLLASRHTALYGTTSEGLGAVAMSARRHAALNDNAVRRTPFTMEEYMASRMVASPLRLLDCSTMVDGAGAVVVTTLDRARDLPHKPVSVRGLASRTSCRTVSQFLDFDNMELKAVADRALHQAGVELSDVDVAEIHDAFTISVLVYLEEIGFCKRGEGSDYALGGNLDLGSACPVNTHGGLLSQGHVAGFLHMTEAVKQIRGDAGAHQVPGAEVAMVAGNGGMFGVNAVMILGEA
jgi:acetyl-CoA acetyltransferase